MLGAQSVTMSEFLFAQPSLAIVSKQQKGERLRGGVADAPFTSLHAFLPADFSNSCLVEALAEDGVTFAIPVQKAQRAFNVVQMFQTARHVILSPKQITNAVPRCTPNSQLFLTPHLLFRISRQQFQNLN
jgi:hypothetical protein